MEAPVKGCPEKQKTANDLCATMRVVEVIGAKGISYSIFRLAPDSFSAASSIGQIGTVRCSETSPAVTRSRDPDQRPASTPNGKAPFSKQQAFHPGPSVFASRSYYYQVFLTSKLCKSSIRPSSNSRICTRSTRACTLTFKHAGTSESIKYGGQSQSPSPAAASSNYVLLQVRSIQCGHQIRQAMPLQVGTHTFRG
jgi:hypothetical protein